MAEEILDIEATTVDPGPGYGLWKRLNKDNLYKKDYAQFQSQFPNEQRQKVLFDKLSSGKYYTDDWDKFKSEFTVPEKKKISPNASNSGASLSNTGSVPSQVSPKDSLAGFSERLNAMPDLRERAKIMETDPNAPEYQEMRKNAVPVNRTWENTVPMFTHAVTRMFSEAVGGTSHLLRDVIGKLDPKTTAAQKLYDKTGNLTPFAKRVEAGLETDPLGRLAIGLDAYTNITKQEDAQNQLPDTFLGNTSSGLINIAPDLAATALFPEGKAATWLGGAVKNPFTKLLATKGALNGYSSAKQEGSDMTGALKESLVGGLEGAAEGVIMHGLGTVAGNYVSPTIAKGLEKTGLFKDGKITKMGSDALADAAVFGAYPFVPALLKGELPSLSEIEAGVGMGLGFGIMKAGNTFERYKEIEQRQLEEVNNASAVNSFLNADPETIVEIGLSNKSSGDMMAEAVQASAEFRKKANEPEKIDAAAAASTLYKAAGVKNFTEAIINDKQGIVETVSSLDIDPGVKEALLQKIEAIYPQVHPAERAKNDLGELVREKDAEIAALTEQASNTADPVRQAEAEVALPVAEAERKTMYDGIKDIATEQQNPNVIPAVDEAVVSDVMGRPVIYNGEPATLEIDGQTVIAKIRGTNKEYEVGNVEELINRPISELGIEAEESNVIGKGDKFTIRDKEYVNPYSEPRSAINYDEAGNVLSVNLETPEGAKRAFRGQMAEDIAYEIELNRLNKDNEAAGRFEQFVEQSEPSKQEILSANDAEVEPQAPERVAETVPSTGDVVETTEVVESAVKPAVEPAVEPVKVVEPAVEPVKVVEPAVEPVKVVEPAPKAKEQPKVEAPAEKTIKNEDNKDRRKELGLDDLPATPRQKLTEVEQKAQKAIDEGTDYMDLADRVNKNEHQASAEEIGILSKAIDIKENDIRSINTKLNDESINASDFNKLMDEKSVLLTDFDNLSLAAQKTGTATARALNARRYALGDATSLQNMLNAIRSANKGKPLTKADREYTEKRFTEIDNARKEAFDKAVKSNTKEAAAKIRSEQRKTDRAMKKSEIEVEREQIVVDLKKALKKARSTAQSTILPYANELVAATPFALKMVRNLAKEGVLKIEDVVDRIHETFKEDIEGLTKRDVTDMLAGVYQSTKETRSQLEQEVASLRSQAKLINKIEDAENGVTTTPKQAREKDAKVEALKKQLRDITKSDNPRLDAYKKQLESRIADIEKRVQEGDFNERSAEPLVLDAEALEARRKYDRLRHDWAVEVEKRKLEDMGTRDKIIDAMFKVGGSIKAIKASMDFSSAILRQGLFLTVPNPREAAASIRNMANFVRSEKAYKDWLLDLQHHPLYETMKDSGLYIADNMDAKLTAREEEFAYNVVGVGLKRAAKYLDTKPGGKLVSWLLKAFPASERAYVGYLNSIRTGVFAKGAEALMREGKTFEQNPQEFKELARVVNILSGRGELPKLLQGQAASTLLFSPRYIASQVQTLILPAIVKTPYARKIAAKNIGVTVAAMTSILLMAQATGNKVEWNPLSDNWLAIQDKEKKGTSFYKLFGSIPRLITTVAQIALRKKKNKAGKLVPLKGFGDPSPFAKDPGEVGMHYLRGKLAPAVGVGVNFLTGRDYAGREYSVSDVPRDLLVPLPFTEWSDAYKVGGLANAIETTIASQEGISVTSYDPNQKPKK